MGHIKGKFGFMPFLCKVNISSFTGFIFFTGHYYAALHLYYELFAMKQL